MIHKRAKIAVVLLLVFQMVVPAPIFAAAVGHFTSLSGNVTQTRVGVTIKPQVRYPVEVKDLIVTGDRSAATMVFDDESTISLASNSKFEIRDFSVKDKARKGLFSLSLGKLMADVRKFIGGSNSFEIHTPTAVAGVRGTGFEVAVAMIGGQMTTTVTCTAGALSVSAVSVTGAVFGTTGLVAGQSAIITSAGLTVSAAAVGAGAAAAGAGGAAGAGAAAGVTAGTIAVGAAVAATAITAAATTAGSDVTTTHITTTTHH